MYGSLGQLARAPVAKHLVPKAIIVFTDCVIQTALGRSIKDNGERKGNIGTPTQRPSEI